MQWNPFENELKGVPWTIEPSIATMMGCALWASPWVVKAEEVINMLDTICLQQKV